MSQKKEEKERNVNMTKTAKTPIPVYICFFKYSICNAFIFVCRKIFHG